MIGSEMSNLFICGIDEITTYHSAITHLITIANPGTVREAPDWFLGEHLQFLFGDVISDADAVQCKTKAANIDDIRQAIIFFRVARQMDSTRLLISCDYGASRSPALAYVLLADQYGVGREAEALRDIIGIRPESVPNRLVVELGDMLLNRSGALLAALREYYQQLDFCC
jgi:predicted protein tyrosine phosphatase